MKFIMFWKLIRKLKNNNRLDNLNYHPVEIFLFEPTGTWLRAVSGPVVNWPATSIRESGDKGKICFNLNTYKGISPHWKQSEKSNSIISIRSSYLLMISSFTDHKNQDRTFFLSPVLEYLEQHSAWLPNSDLSSGSKRFPIPISVRPRNLELFSWMTFSLFLTAHPAP